MRGFKLIICVGFVTFANWIIPAAAEDAPKPAATAPIRTCSANSSDRTQSCSVICPEGKTATCVGAAQGAKDVDCTCK